MNDKLAQVMAENKRLSGNIATMLIKISQINEELHESRKGHAILTRRVIETIAENDRYRKALQRISDHEYPESEGWSHAEHLSGIAEEALQQSKEGGDQ